MCAYYVLAVRCILCETPSQILFFLYIYTAGLKSFTFPVFLYNIIINHYYNNAVNAAYTFLPYNYILQHYSRVKPLSIASQTELVCGHYYVL